MADKKHPIIAHGELYVEPITKKGGGGPKKIPHEYGLAKQKIIADIDKISHEIQQKREVFLNEKIICVRMEPKFEAKSYVPQQLLADESMDIVGGRKYSFIDDFEKTQSAKLYFIKADDRSMGRLRHILASGQRDRIEAWRNQIGSIHSMDLLHPDEKVMGFSEEWIEGAVEIVLHPLVTEYSEMLDLFYRISKIPVENTKVKTYEDGLTFISAKCGRDELENLKFFNPLRAAHPLGRIGVTPVRILPSASSPQPPTSKKRSSITVGVFDGGADEKIPLLDGYVKAIDCVSTIPDDRYLSHGSSVCGVVLHGNLAGKAKTDVLPVPCVVVESYRVLPIKDQNDFELYEAIDAIESIVNARPDIKLYNISFGPAGAIVDDSINRFTYVLDRLTYNVEKGDVNPLFCVAAGNDGELCDPFNRIQSPADMVNGLGVGAYTFLADGTKTKASYSCVGTGREGAKVKPDFLDFGGSIDRPFVLVGLKPGTLAGATGTSFSSPLTVNKIGKLMAQSKDIAPHMGRTLLIHNALTDDELTQNEQGYGYCQEDVDNVLSCEDKSVTILYSGTLEPAETVHLPIFSPRIDKVKGMINISWTITTIVSPNANDPDAYTNNCIEDAFIPHDMTFKFFKKDPKTKKLTTRTLNLLKEDDVIKARALFAEGYTRSEFPVSHSTKHSWNETDLRLIDLKWDTVIRKQQRMRGSSLLNPALTFHAIDRNGFGAQSIQYYVAITVEAPKYSGSLYDAILQTYQNLAPIEIRNVNRIMVDASKERSY